MKKRYSYSCVGEGLFSSLGKLYRAGRIEIFDSHRQDGYAIDEGRFFLPFEVSSQIEDFFDDLETDYPIYIQLGDVKSCEKAIEEYISDKKYFVEYISFPLNKKIEIGDIVKEKLNNGKFDYFQIHTLNDIDIHTQIPVRMCLCSKDIKMNDEFYTDYDFRSKGLVSGIDNGMIFNGTSIQYDKDNCFKIVGEIFQTLKQLSPGMRIDPSQVKFLENGKVIIN